MKTLTVSGIWDNGYGWDYPFTAVFSLAGEKLIIESLEIDHPMGDSTVSDRTYQGCEQQARDLAWNQLAEEAKL